MSFKGKEKKVTDASDDRDTQDTNNSINRTLFIDTKKLRHTRTGKNMLAYLLSRISSNYKVMQHGNTSSNHLMNRKAYDKRGPDLKRVFHASHKSAKNTFINHAREAR